MCTVYTTVHTVRTVQPNASFTYSAVLYFHLLKSCTLRNRIVGVGGKLRTGQLAYSRAHPDAI